MQSSGPSSPMVRSSGALPLESPWCTGQKEVQSCCWSNNVWICWDKRQGIQIWIPYLMGEEFLLGDTGSSSLQFCHCSSTVLLPSIIASTKVSSKRIVEPTMKSTLTRFLFIADGLHGFTATKSTNTDTKALNAKQNNILYGCCLAEGRASTTALKGGSLTSTSTW